MAGTTPSVILVDILRRAIGEHRDDPALNQSQREQARIIDMRFVERSLTRISLWYQARVNWDTRYYKLKENKYMSQKMLRIVNKRHSALIEKFERAVEAFIDGEMPDDPPEGDTE